MSIKIIEGAVADTSETEKEILALLNAWAAGDESARNRLVEIILPEIRRIATARLRRVNRAVSLQTGDVVNEVIIKLISYDSSKIVGRVHLQALVVRMTFNFLADYSRRKFAEKRNGLVITLTDSHEGKTEKSINFTVYASALMRLAVIDEMTSNVVMLRFFGNMTVQDAAQALGIPLAKVNRLSARGLQWLADALKHDF
ncbi:MAG: sigma-70 family RNA polymerase sigma factor [Parvularculaceae bacterium]|nr:sigma-70 family RNA polymerase sigma factor [Parvularculaceae bacterium]